MWNGTSNIKPPKNAPAYDPHGKIKEPSQETAEAQDESSAFYKSLAILKKGLDIDQALDMLEDISHDIYYGLKITEDTSAVHSLFCLMVGTGEETPEGVKPRDLQAAAILSGALSNNPTALKEVSQAWPSLKAKECVSCEFTS